MVQGHLHPLATKGTYSKVCVWVQRLMQEMYLSNKTRKCLSQSSQDIISLSLVHFASLQFLDTGSIVSRFRIREWREGKSLIRS
uniref:Uncharacterized protein n=1 Tax=Pyxicephalus adspersus TaxID=30357 RepID=A0AAV3B4Q4_PYXAD|nr:TPA: hypothetical protein GDO54_000504 [Pyxicephalus adspersus]